MNTYQRKDTEQADEKKSLAAVDIVFAFSKDESSMNFSVEASVALEGKFDKWEAPISDVAIAC